MDKDAKERQKQVRDGIITDIAKACPSMKGTEALNLVDTILKHEKALGVVIQTDRKFWVNTDIFYYETKPLIGGKADV